MFDFLISSFTIAGIYALMAFGLNLQAGYAGLLNFGHIAFAGLGAYAAGIGFQLGWSPLASLGLGLCSAMLLGLSSLAYIARMTRSFMLTQLNQEYVTLARAKGASERTVIWRHALKNARVQIITVCFLSYGFLLEGAVLTETVFSWPGLGLYMTNALFNADLNAVIGGTILIGAVFIILNALADVVYRFAEPRTA